MNKEKWYCEKCDTWGEVEYEDQEGVFSVIEKIERNHRELSPDCTQPVGEIKIIREEVN